MPNVFNKEKYTVKVRDVYVPVDNNYLEFLFSHGDNEVSEYELELLKGNRFFNHSIKNKKSALSIKTKQKPKNEKAKEKIKKTEEDTQNDSKPISEVQIKPEGQ